MFTPCAKEKVINKAKATHVDGIILDLEDSISPNGKDEARQNVVNALANGDGFMPKTTVALRVNGAESPWMRDDLEALVANPAALESIDAIVLPKVNGQADVDLCVRTVLQLLQQQVGKGGGGVMSGGQVTMPVPIWAMIESPLGVINVEEIARHQDVSCLVLGTADLTKDMQARHTLDRLPMMYSLSKSLLAARAYGKRALDGVHLDLKDEEGFRSVCTQGRDMGFDGKTLIHPSTIQSANEIFAPTEEEVAKARRIVDAWIEAEKTNAGVTVVDGRLVERLHVEDAQRLLEMHSIISQ
jgi:citrate lyase subunit beta/citryl-CoA lyase